MVLPLSPLTPRSYLFLKIFLVVNLVFRVAVATDDSDIASKRKEDQNSTVFSEQKENFSEETPQREEKSSEETENETTREQVDE